MRKDGRPDHIEDALIKIHSNQWFTWTDSKNKIYANLRLTEKVGVDGNLVDNSVIGLSTIFPSIPTFSVSLRLA